MMAGRLDTTIDGRPLRIDAWEQTLRLTFPSPWAGWRSRKAFRYAFEMAASMARVTNLRCEVAFGKWAVLSVLPTPHWSLRPFVGSRAGA